MKKTGAPLLQVFSSPDSEGLKVEQAFFPLCPLEGARKGAMFTSDEQSTINFIGESILLEMHSTLQDVPSVTKKVALDVVSDSKILSIEFRKACKKALSARRRTVKDIYFGMLGYSSICATAAKSSGQSFYKAQMGEEIKARLKLYKQTDDERDFSFWRTAEFADICNEVIGINTIHDSPSTDTDGADTLFSNEPARVTFRTFMRYEMTENTETTIISLARLDAMMACIVDSLCEGHSTEITGSDPDPLALESPSNHGTSNDVSLVTSGQSEVMPSKKRGRSRGGRKPMQNVRNFQRYLPIAVCQLSNFCLSQYKSAVNRLNLVMDNMDRISSIGCEYGQGSVLDNSTRHHTLAFRYPTNGHIYIALTCDAFADYICEWVGVVSDCYVLHSASKLAPLRQFRKDDALDLLHDSDEENDVPQTGEIKAPTSGIHDSFEQDESDHLGVDRGDNEDNCNNGHEDVNDDDGMGSS